MEGQNVPNTPNRRSLTAYFQANNRISGIIILCYITFLTHGWYDVKIPRVICLQHVMPREMQLLSGFALSGQKS
jgi:hypothetical protein